jgi:hypothetical protein
MITPYGSKLLVDNQELRRKELMPPGNKRLKILCEKRKMANRKDRVSNLDIARWR